METIMNNQYFAERLEDIPGPEVALSMSGMDFMLKILNGKLPLANIARGLNFKLSSVEKGIVSFTGAPTLDHFNPMGMIHGGWYGTLLDSAMACAVQTLAPRGTLVTTLEYKINIIKPISLNTRIEAKGTINHVGKSTGVAHGSIIGIEDGELYATGSTTCILMQF
jgi:uncharacterized protein (TIGR00369 family)